jgi:hypothetical protein
MSYHGHSVLRIAFVMAEAPPKPVGGGKPCTGTPMSLPPKAIRSSWCIHRSRCWPRSGRVWTGIRNSNPRDLGPRTRTRLGRRKGAGNLILGTSPTRGPRSPPTGSGGAMDSRSFRFRYRHEPAGGSWVEGYSQRMGRKIHFLLDYESYMLGDSEERRETRRTLATDWPIVVRSWAVRRLVESVAAPGAGGCRHEMYAEDGCSAVLCPPRDPPAMAAAILRLTEDDALRQRIARKGARSLVGSTWREAAIAFERLLVHVTRR